MAVLDVDHACSSLQVDFQPNFIGLACGLVPSYVHHVNRVKTCNDCAIMTAPEQYAVSHSSVRHNFGKC